MGSKEGKAEMSEKAMSDLVERVARALFQHADGRLGPWPDLETRDSYWSEAEAALAAILETHAIVPREPTEATDIAFWEWWSDDRGQLVWRPLYAAWITAAPDPLE
jgi:hypothetical protein